MQNEKWPAATLASQNLFFHFDFLIFNSMATPKKKPAATKSNSPTQQRLWLMYPPKLIKQPFIWEIGHKFKVVTNIRQASVTDEIGIVCLELEGPRDEVKTAIKWLEKQGVNVEPVEIGVIAG
jgi:ABC-type methionine transport system ATPase subunit